ncbi:SHOCT domain-containing protein [Williamsia muralis]|uniref:SHOCT domain-containing protein n=1 Tax=Williamsia marianensis TaxID=85044 RepID=UPI003F14098B
MPGLLRGVARTAVIAGTATSVSNRVSRRQGRRWSGQGMQQQPPQYAEPPQAPQAPTAASGTPTSTDRINALKELADLKAQGILTDTEFAAEKAKILST